MSATSDLTRAVWLWLLQNGGRHTAAEVAQGLKLDTESVFMRLQSLAQKGQIIKYPPAANERRIRYGVTGMCGIPQGMQVAEVQAC